MARGFVGTVRNPSAAQMRLHTDGTAIVALGFSRVAAAAR